MSKPVLLVHERGVQILDKTKHHSQDRMPAETMSKEAGAYHRATQSARCRSVSSV